MVMTGVKCTDEELSWLTNLARRGWQDGDIVMVPNIAVGIAKDEATIDAKKACHALALKHGLPEFEGYYGVTHDGEFVKAG